MNNDVISWYIVEYNVRYEFFKFSLILKFPSAETGIYWENYITTMAADAMAPCIAQP